MQFRCFRCGLVFSDGPPPLEALSVQQTQAVGTADPGVDYSMLDGTVFEGLSPYNFCAFCIYAIQSFPKAFEEDDVHVLQQQSISARRITREGVEHLRYTNTWCSCGHPYMVENGSTSHRDFWRQVNRSVVAHKAMMSYPNAEPDKVVMLYALIESDV